MQVSLRENESFESLLKRFRTGVSRHGIISEYKRHQSYLSKGERLRAKMQRAERKRQARLAKAAKRAVRRAA